MSVSAAMEVSPQRVVVRRRPWGKWYMGAIGIVMVLHGGGVSFDWYPTRRILELIYPGRDIPGFETRDRIWAVAFLVIGVFLIAVTVGRVSFRRPVIQTSEAGILLSVGGPLARPIPISWDQVQEIEAGVVEDEFGAYSALLLRIDDVDLSGSEPWQARWDDGVLCIPASEWNCRAEKAVEMLAEARRLAVAAGRTDEEATESGSTEIDVSLQQSGEDGVTTEEGSAVLPEAAPTREGFASSERRLPQ